MTIKSLISSVIAGKEIAGKEIADKEIQRLLKKLDSEIGIDTIVGFELRIY